MFRGLIRSFALVLLLSLGACAGNNFVRAPDDSLHLGQTTYAEIAAKMGKPYQTGAITKNGTTIRTVSYAYANTGGDAQATGVTAARSQGFYFADDKLVGYEFTSSWKADSSDFDGSKVGQIQKGKSTKADVHALIGPPGGQYIYPMVAAQNGIADVYLNFQTSGTAFNLKQYRKVLVVTYGTDGVVSDVNYTESGNK